jgi:chromosome segregation ATPase
MEVRCAALEGRLKALRAENDALLKDREAEQPHVQELEAAVAVLEGKVRRGAEECESLREHVRDQSNEATGLANSLHEARSALSRATRESGDKERRLQQEVYALKMKQEPMERHVASLEKEAREKAAALSEAKAAANEQAAVLKGQIVTLTADVEILQSSSAELQLQLAVEEKAHSNQQVCRIHTHTHTHIHTHSLTH